MKYFSKTFKSKYSIWVYLFIYLFAFFVCHKIWNITDFQLDKTRIGASQSIGTYEIGLILLMAIIVVPIFLCLTILASINYPKSVSLMCWNKARPYWSIFWTLAFSVLMIYPAGTVIDEILRNTIVFHPESLVLIIVSIHYFLYLRASLIMSTLFSNQTRQTKEK